MARVDSYNYINSSGKSSIAIFFGNDNTFYPGLLMDAVKHVMSSEDFAVDAPQAKAAIKVATDLAKWTSCQRNYPTVKDFSKYLVASLSTCLDKKKLKFKTRRGRMWTNFHTLRISEDFRGRWAQFLGKCTSEAPPAFYQYVTQRMFEGEVKREFAVTAHCGNSPEELTPDDRSAVRYVAGYICRKIREKLERTKIQGKNDMLLTLFEFRSSIHSEDQSEDWIKAIDRGGLWHVIDDVYVLFCYIEENIRAEVADITAETWCEEHKQKLMDSLKVDEDIQFQWEVLVYELETVVAQKLLQMLLELYITVRGFAFANSIMELYKQSKKTNLQKSKAVRRKVYESTD